MGSDLVDFYECCWSIEITVASHWIGIGWYFFDQKPSNEWYLLGLDENQAHPNF
jgi:hypothetical protein